MEVAIFLLIVFAPALFFAYRARKYKKEVKKLNEENENLRPYAAITDAQSHAAKILDEANKKAETIVKEAEKKLRSAQEKEGNASKQLRSLIEEGKEQARVIIKRAEQEAVEIAGKAMEARDKADLYEKAVEAMKNIIQGYGNEYVIPSYSLLDDLAESYGHTQAGEDLKKARSSTRELVKTGYAAECDYVETQRRNTAINFVIDAFNGKVDTILSRAKIDNYGKLKQEILDAFNLVNFNGKSFRNARIKDEYLTARLEELRLVCTVNEIKQRDMEEQRRIKEQIREEEKARKEIEKALREAQKEEEMLQKAMDTIRGKFEKASEEQKAKYELQLAELEQKWKEAEEKNQRALSMAQQTKRGHVYIISNIGSFGENVYKIGMTRRLEPTDRVRELGDASVPFGFDVHAMIWADDAPALEAELHKHFALNQINKVNYRKEFFRAPLTEIRKSVESFGIIAKWTMKAEAKEYQESLAIDREIAKDPEQREAWLNRNLVLGSDITEAEEKEALEIA